MISRRDDNRRGSQDYPLMPAKVANMAYQEYESDFKGAGVAGWLQLIGFIAVLCFIGWLISEVF